MEERYDEYYENEPLDIDLETEIDDTKHHIIELLDIATIVELRLIDDYVSIIVT